MAPHDRSSGKVAVKVSNMISSCHEGPANTDCFFVQCEPTQKKIAMEKKLARAILSRILKNFNKQKNGDWLHYTQNYLKSFMSLILK